MTQQHHNPKERSSQLLLGESLKSRRAMLFVGYRWTIGSQTTFPVLCLRVRKIAKTTISFAISVHPHETTGLPLTDFHEIWCLNVLRKFV
jgi:hypothetical protein